MFSRADFCCWEIFGEILKKFGEISSRPSGNTDNTVDIYVKNNNNYYVQQQSKYLKRNALIPKFLKGNKLILKCYISITLLLIEKNLSH